MGDGVMAAARGLPPGGGIIVRHDHLPQGQRMRLVRELRAVARARRCMLMLAGTPRAARAAGADGAHLRRPRRALVRAARRQGLMTSAPAHDRGQVRAASRAGIDRLFVSPVYPTRSHPAAAVLGARGLARLVHEATASTLALGGMDARRARRLRRQGFAISGWGAIDALTPRPDAARR